MHQLPTWRPPPACARRRSAGRGWNVTTAIIESLANIGDNNLLGHRLEQHRRRPGRMACLPGASTAACCLRSGVCAPRARPAPADASAVGGSAAGRAPEQAGLQQRGAVRLHVLHRDRAPGPRAQQGQQLRGRRPARPRRQAGQADAPRVPQLPAAPLLRLPARARARSARGLRVRAGAWALRGWRRSRARGCCARRPLTAQWTAHGYTRKRANVPERRVRARADDQLLGT